MAGKSAGAIGRANQRNGTAFERVVRNWLRDYGFGVMRAAASAGEMKADLIAVRFTPGYERSWNDPRREIGQHLWIQCKRTDWKLPPLEWNTFLRFSRLAGALPVIAYRDKDWPGDVHFLQIKDFRVPGSSDWPVDDLAIDMPRLIR